MAEIDLRRACGICRDVAEYYVKATPLRKNRERLFSKRTRGCVEGERKMATVCKFGGTSTADGNMLSIVKKIVERDENRQWIVTSAPGKRYAADVKVTDLLKRAYNAAKDGDETLYRTIFSKIEERYVSIVKETGGCAEFVKDVAEEIGEIRERIFAEKDEAYALSRGEYIIAKIAARRFGLPFVDATRFIFFDKDGRLDEERTYEACRRVFKVERRAVVPGYYGVDENGKIRTFSRGGGDVTGAILARAVGAKTYEKWTDVSGFYPCDPKIVSGQSPVKKMTYDELNALIETGAEVVHPYAAEIARGGGVTVRVRNTFRPNDEGTDILPSVSRIDGRGDVTGIVVRRGRVFAILKDCANGETDCVEAALKCRGIETDLFEKGGRELLFVCAAKEKQKETLKKLVEEAIGGGKAEFFDDRAIVRIVGKRGFANVEAQIEVLKAVQSVGKSDARLYVSAAADVVTVVLREERCERLASALYRSFFENEDKIGL